MVIIMNIPLITVKYHVKKKKNSAQNSAQNKAQYGTNLKIRNHGTKTIKSSVYKMGFHGIWSVSLFGPLGTNPIGTCYI